MSNIFARWFGFGLGAAAGRALFDEPGEKAPPPDSPTGARTEAEFKRDEKRFAEDEKRLDEQSRR